MIALPTELHTAWQAALEQWNQPTRHDNLLGLAAKHGQLAWLAARYRDAARTNPEDQIAPHRLARVQRAAIVTFAMPRVADEPTTKKYRGVAMLLIGGI